MGRGRREAGILAGTYHDRLTVERSRLVTDPATRESVEQWETLYDRIPCALSQASNDSPEHREVYSRTARKMVIFTCPDVELLDNDRAVVETEAGQRVTGTTGRTFRYVSHGETPYTVEEMA